MKRHTKEGVRGLRLLPFYLFTFLLFLAACTSIDCPVNNRVRTIYALMKADGTPDTLNKDTMWIWTPRIDGNDTLVSHQTQNNLELNFFFGSSATTFDLPISYTQPEDVLYVLVKNISGTQYRDTIRIQKENTQHFESVDCQASYFHTITAVSTTHEIIDSIVINNPNVNYDQNTTHFKLYLKANR